MAHTHSIFDTDKRFVIDPVTRAIANQSTNKVVLIQFDHNSERFTFEVPRYVEEHDMSQSTVARIYFRNGGSEDYYEADDLQVSPDDEETVIFSWLISRNATQNVAPLEFLAKFRCYDGEEVVYEWNTATFSKFSIIPGMDAGDGIADKYPDALKTLADRVETLESEPEGPTSTDTWTLEFEDGTTETKEVYVK